MRGVDVERRRRAQVDVFVRLLSRIEAMVVGVGASILDRQVRDETVAEDER